MDEMLDLSREDALEIDDFRYNGDPSIKYVTRHMARLLARELTWENRANSQSLRGLWYSGAKMVYQNLYPERWGTEYYEESASRRFSQSLSTHISDMVKEGALTYKDLNIIDDSRKREIVGTDRIEHQKILFVEKETKYRQLLPLTDVLGASVVSGGGWQATALIEDLANVLEDDESYEIYVLTDFDPTGYNIASDFRRRSRQLGIDIDRVERVGIEPEQIPQDTLDAEKFRVPVEDEGDEEWLQKHGIKNSAGEPVYGLELEAIGERGSQAADFRRVVTDALEPHLNQRRRRSKDLNIQTASVAQNGVEELVDSITEDLVDRLMEYAVEIIEDEIAVDSVTYHPEEGYVSAAADLDIAESQDSDLVPEPLDFEAYLKAAIEGEESPSPDRFEHQDHLVEMLTAEMRDTNGKLDVEDLINLEQ